MLVADKGIDWAMRVTPDPRMLRKIKGSDFEVVPPAGFKP